MSIDHNNEVGICLCPISLFSLSLFAQSLCSEQHTEQRPIYSLSDLLERGKRSQRLDCDVFCRTVLQIDALQIPSLSFASKSHAIVS